jgi:hypothetical protein
MYLLETVYNNYLYHAVVTNNNQNALVFLNKAVKICEK